MASQHATNDLIYGTASFGRSGAFLPDVASCAEKLRMKKLLLC